MARAFITGITGQDGSYLAEILLDQGYDVHAMMRRSCVPATERIDHLLDQISLHYGDVTDPLRVIQLIGEIEPDEIYNLAAQSDVRISFDTPLETYRSIAIGGLNVLESVRLLGLPAKIYQAVSSEMFGQESPPQNESTKMSPVSPYACAKVSMYNMGLHYRRSYGMFVANGILFNHESPRRGTNFVTRKITLAAARIKNGLQDKLYLGNLEAKRDWGYAPEYTKAMIMMLQNPLPDDFVIATGEEHSVQEFLEEVFDLADLEVSKHVEIDPDLYRTTEVPSLRGDSTKAKELLGWNPRVSFKELAKIMYEADLKAIGGAK